MKIVRTTSEWVRGEYVLDVDEALCKDLLNDLNAKIINDEDKLTSLTCEDIANIVVEYYDDGSIFDKSVLMIGWNGQPTEIHIGDTLHDWLNEMIWDSDYEIVDGETEDWTDEVDYGH